MDMDHIITYTMIYLVLLYLQDWQKILPIEKCIIFLDTLYKQFLKVMTSNAL